MCLPLGTMAYVEVAKLIPIFRPSAPTLKFGLSAVEADKAIKEACKQAVRFVAVANGLVKKHEAEECKITAEFIAETQREILVLAIAPAIKAKYAHQVEVADTYEKMVTFIKSILGPDLTPDQKP